MLDSNQVPYSGTSEDPDDIPCQSERAEGCWHPTDSSGRSREGHRPRQFRRRQGGAGHASRQDQAQPACPRPRPPRQSRQGAGIARGQGGGDRCRFPGDPLGGSLCRRRPDELPRPVAQRHGAGQGALRRPCRCRRGCPLADNRGRCGGVDRGRVRGAAARHRCRSGDGGGCAAVARRSLYPGRRAQAGKAVEHRQASGLFKGRRRCRLPPGRCRGRAALYDPAGASGLYRAARLRRLRRLGRAGADLGQQPGPVHDPRLLREAARYRYRQHSCHPGRDRRRFRWQDLGLCRTGGAGAVEEDRAGGQDRDDPRRSVPGHRPNLGRRHRGQARSQEGRRHRRRRARAQIPGRRLPRLAGTARLHVRLCDVRSAECADHRLRRRLEPAEGRGVPRPGRADLVVWGRELHRRAGA